METRVKSPRENFLWFTFDDDPRRVDLITEHAAVSMARKLRGLSPSDRLTILNETLDSYFGMVPKNLIEGAKLQNIPYVNQVNGTGAYQPSVIYRRSVAQAEVLAQFGDSLEQADPEKLKSFELIHHSVAFKNLAPEQQHAVNKTQQLLAQLISAAKK